MKKNDKYIQPHRTPRTTIGIKADTKEKLDQHRAPGQCYDGFICQLLEMWEESRSYDHHRTLPNTKSIKQYANTM
jgi:hypothetical protein